MTKKQKAIWRYCQQMVSKLTMDGFPPFDKVKWFWAVKKKKTIVMAKIDVPNAENRSQILWLVDCFQIMGDVLSCSEKQFAKDAYNTLVDIAIHEIGEHFKLNGIKSFDQHVIDPRYLNEPLEKKQDRYQKWMKLAEEQAQEIYEEEHQQDGMVKKDASRS